MIPNADVFELLLDKRQAGPKRSRLLKRQFDYNNAAK
jgi:hypothetical protein